MATNFIPSGVELIAKNLGQFLADVGTANKAIAGIGAEGAASVALPGLQGLGNAIVDIGAKAAMVAAGGIAALGAAVTATVVKGTEKAADLEQALANIAATSGKTIQEVAPLKDLITQLALDPNLKVTTDEAAASVQALTKQGLDMTTIIQGAGRATVALSNATGADFGNAATITSGIMKAFNIQAKDMSQVIDGATGVMTNSKFTIDDYGLAFAQAGAIASNLGVSLKDFNTIVAATASSFSSGSDAGTSFKNLLLRLSAPTDEMKKIMKEYGISLFDAQGNMRSMTDVVTQLNQVLQGNVSVTETVGGATKKQAAAAKQASEEMPKLQHSIESQSAKLKLLNDTYGLTVQYYGEGSPKARALKLQIDDLSFSLGENQKKYEENNSIISQVAGSQAKQITSTKKLTEAERAKIAEALGGTDSARLILSLSKLTGAEFDKLSAKVNKSGLAFGSASTRMETAQGALEILRGIVESIQIQIGEKFLPIVTRIAKAMSEWANKHAADVVEFFGKVSSVIDNVIASGVKLYALFSAGGLALFADVFGVQGIYLWAQIQQLIANVTKALGDFGATLSSILPDFTGLSQGVIPALTAGIKFLNDNFTAFAGALGGIVAAGALGIIVAALAALAAMVTPVTVVIAIAGALGAAWATNFLGIRDYTLAAWAAVQPILTELITWLGTNIPIAITAASTFWTTTLLPAVTAVSAYFTANILPILTEIATWLGTNIPIAIAAVSAFWTTTLLPAITAAGTYFTTVLVPAFLQLSDTINTYIVVAVTTLVNIWNTVLMPALTGFWNFVQGSLIPVTNSLFNLMQAVGYKATEALAGLWSNLLAPALTTVNNYIMSKLIPIFNSLVKILNSINTYIMGNIIPAFTSFQTKTTEASAPIAKFTDKLIPSFLSGMQNVKRIIQDVTGFFNSLASTVRNFTLPEVLQRHSPSPFEQTLMGIANNANAATGAMSKLSGSISQSQLDKILGVQRGVASTMNSIGAASDFAEKKLEARMGGAKARFSLNVLKDVFRKNSAQILGAGDIKQQVMAFQKLASTAVNWEKAGISGSQSSAINTVIDTFVKTYHTEQARLEKLQQEIFVNAGKKALDIGRNLNDIIKTSSDILDNRVNTLQDIVDSGLKTADFEGKTITQTEAQQKLNEALKQQADIQAQLDIEAENETKLNFLEKQLNLLDTINKAGLNASDILGGLTLGLDASIPDVIEATNRLVTAMITQVNSDLQIHSPSKVMFSKGRMTGKGFAEGAESSIPAVNSIFQRIASIPSLLGSQAANTYSSVQSTVNNYNFGMNVNTGAAAQSVIQQYSIMQAMLP